MKSPVRCSPRADAAARAARQPPASFLSKRGGKNQTSCPRPDAASSIATSAAPPFLNGTRSADPPTRWARGSGIPGSGAPDARPPPSVAAGGGGRTQLGRLPAREQRLRGRRHLAPGVGRDLGRLERPRQWAREAEVRDRHGPGTAPRCFPEALSSSFGERSFIVSDVRGAGGEGDGMAHEQQQHTHLWARRARFAAARSFSLASLTVGYARSSEDSASITAAATTTRVNHLLSAGTTYHGARLVAVFRIVSSYASM